MRLPRARFGASMLLAGAVALTSSAFAPAALGETTPAPIGGPLLGGHGIIVQPQPGAPALPTGLSSSSWLVADADTGEVLAAKAPHDRFLPASTLKTLTALTLIPRLDPKQLVKVVYDDAVVDGSKVGLVPGMNYTVDKLFTCMLVVSANDAADALAQAAGGTRTTVSLMNAEARHLKALDTHAGTPSGLDARGEHTSAYDLALIARAAMKLPAFMRYVQTVKSTVPAPHHKHFQIYTHNQLLTTYPGDLGGKNGYTVAADGTYVGFARRGGHTLIITLMHAYPDFWPEARDLFNWGFHAIGHVEPIGTLVDPVSPPAPAQQVSEAAASRTTTVVLPTHHAGPLALWQYAALAASVMVAVVVTMRRHRRRPRRLTLPRL